MHCATLARGLHFFDFLGIPVDYRGVFLVGPRNQFRNPILKNIGSLQNQAGSDFPDPRYFSVDLFGPLWVHFGARQDGIGWNTQQWLEYIETLFGEDLIEMSKLFTFIKMTDPASLSIFLSN